MKLIDIVGARPQIIKAGAVNRAIAQHNKKYPDRTIIEIILHTGQHYDRNMSEVFFDELDIPQPDYNLGVGSGSHAEQTGKMLHKIESVLIEERPDCCLVYGDTNSTLAGALAAAKLHIPIAHVEAGLRSFNRRMPEEINRVLTDHISELLFCPTQTSVDNLAKEGVSAGVHRVGDVMYDCILFCTEKTKPIEQKILERLRIQSKSYCLATVHRAENTDGSKQLSNILEALNEIATKDRPVVLPLHPRTIKHIHRHGLEFADWVKVIKPVSYLNMVALENNAGLILTDSGGIQKEAYWLGVPCITLRDETEWVETVESGWNILAGANKQHIINGVRHGHRRRDVAPDSVYGNGNAANQICDILQRSQT